MTKEGRGGKRTGHEIAFGIPHDLGEMGWTERNHVRQGGGSTRVFSSGGTSVFFSGFESNIILVRLNGVSF